MTTKTENKKYKEFREEVEKYAGQRVSIDLLQMLVRRFTQGNMGRNIINFKYSKDNPFINQARSKQNYYTFWIKRLHQSGVIKETEFGWEVANVERK